MKLLIITQKVDINDDLLGIYHGWVKKIAAKCESVLVVCLYKGKYDFPENVEVFSLGKEQYFDLPNFFRRLTAVFRFYKYVWKLRKKYDTVFVHMNPEYLILAGWLWKLMGKKTVLWYAHYLDNFKLRLAAPFADKIVTSTKRAFPYEIKKLTVLQQGIDTGKFSPSKKIIKKEENSKLKIISLGRISPVKDLETLIEAVNILKNNNFNFFLDILGEPTDKDADYFEKIKNLIINLGLSDKISLLGKISTSQNPEVYLDYDVFINLTCTGSFDKTILEAMSSGLLCVSTTCPGSPEAIVDGTNGYLVEKSREGVYSGLQKACTLSLRERREMGQRARATAEEKFDVTKNTKKIFSIFGIPFKGQIYA